MSAGSASGSELRLRASLNVHDPGFRAIAALVPPLLLGSALGNVNTLVDRAVGSMVGEGTISSLGYAWRIIGLGETLLVASLLTALYPAFGAAAGGRDLAEMRRLVGRGLATAATVLFPVCGFLFVCAGPLVALLFERGSFGPTDTQRTATAVLWYAPGAGGSRMARVGRACLVRPRRHATTGLGGGGRYGCERRG